MKLLLVSSSGFNVHTAIAQLSIGAVLKLNGAVSPHVLRQTTVHKHNSPHVLVYRIMASVLTKSPLSCY